MKYKELISKSALTLVVVLAAIYMVACQAETPEVVLPTILPTPGVCAEVAGLEHTVILEILERSDEELKISGCVSPDLIIGFNTYLRAVVLKQDGIIDRTHGGIVLPDGTVAFTAPGVDLGRVTFEMGSTDLGGDTPSVGGCQRASETKRVEDGVAITELALHCMPRPVGPGL